mgnify:FL=1
MDARELNIEKYCDDIMHKRTKMTAKPQEISFGLTNKCNIGCSFCVYCGFCKKKIDRVDMMDMENIKKLEPYIDAAASIYGSGRGEPLVYEKFEEFMEYTKESGMCNKLQISTNGMLLGEYKPEVFEKLNMLTISFDSTQKRMFEILRFGAKFEVVRDNIVKIRKDLPNTFISLTVTVNRLNVDHLSDIYEFALENKINAVMFNNVYGSDDDKVIHLLRIRKSDESIYYSQMNIVERMNRQEITKVFQYATFDGYEDNEELDKEKIYQELIELKNTKPYIDFDAYTLGEDDCKFELDNRKVIGTGDIAIPYCTQPFHQFILHADARVFACIGDFAPLDNLNEKQLDEVWNGENFELMREGMFNYDMLPERCKQCNKYPRYANLNVYIEFLEKNNVNLRTVKIPPNFNPPEEFISNENFKRILRERKRLIRNGKVMKKNSQEYWDNRFDTDWKDYGGNEQTKFFATILNDMLPEWLIHEVNENKDKICDLGCAEGDALLVYRQKFVTSEICGEDFSDKAIEYAKKNYPEFEYKVSNILEPEHEKKYPVVICSNVVEHFKETYSVIAKICERATKYAVILIPYREEQGAIDEHERIFHTKDIPVKVEDNYLVCAKSVPCDSAYYPGEQLLLIYAKEKKFYLLSELVEQLDTDTQKTLRDSLNAEIEKCNQEIQERDQKIQERDQKIQERDQKIQERDQEIQERDQEIQERDQKIQECNQQLQGSMEKLEQKENEICELENAMEQCRQQIADLDRQLKVFSQTDANRMTELGIANQNLSMAIALLKQKDEYMLQTQNLCNEFATGKLMQMNHLLFRIKGQLLHGGKNDRKEFWAWLGGRIKKTNRTIGAGAVYNPWMVVNEKLKEAVSCRYVPCGGETANAGNVLEDESAQLLPMTKRELQEEYCKYDVIILSVIDYNFRHQRPQHFATRFAANGHRVFYVNANFVRQDSVTEESENLYVVDFENKDYNAIYAMNGKDTLNWMKQKLDMLIAAWAIRDAIIVVDYPNWVYGAETIKKQYGFQMVTDYMDDYTGFLGTAEDFLKDNCVRLLQMSDLVVASSQFLYDVASKHTDLDKIEIVRNGTEVEHFYQAAGMEKIDKERKVIGYYGAVSHWFAWEKICYLAKTMPECDIVIVGEVTEHRDKLEKYSNIKLLGEKKYQELPKYLADFDVCLIPFDTSTDLIKATNPVKFYEYLSAGKKVVATEIPELMPFRDEYVYMSNDDAKFAEYVKLCMDGTDSLKGQQECIEFARENDWQKRFEAFEEGCTRRIPLVSIIVLTYNNLAMNKQCIGSILQKTAYANYELIVVDNHSTDGTVDYLKELDAKKIPNVTVILNEENLGFAGGNNSGIEKAKGEYVILLNNDTVVTRGWITNLTKHMEHNSKYAMCNPVTNSIGNESKIAVKYSNKVEMEEFAYLYTGTHMGQEYTDVDRLPLFATIIRKSIMEEVGMLDDEYKIGMFEDDDFAESVLNAGYKIAIVEDAFVHHINNGSFKKLEDEEYKRIFETNKKLFEEKWNKKWKMPKYRKGVDWDTNRNEGI